MTRESPSTISGPDLSRLKGRRCLCRNCGQGFNAPSGFDAHRQGPYTDRMCLPSSQMRDAGWTLDSYGYWRMPGRDAS